MRRASLVDRGLYPVAQVREALEAHHIDRMVECKGEHLGVVEMRTHIGHYISGLRGASTVRRALNAAKTAEEQKALLRTLFAQDEQEENQ